MFNEDFEDIDEEEIERQYNELLEKQWDYYDEMCFNDAILNNKISEL